MVSYFGNNKHRIKLAVIVLIYKLVSERKRPVLGILQCSFLDLHRMQYQVSIYVAVIKLPLK